MNSSRERNGVFSVARSNTAPSFEKWESIPNEMAEPVEIFIVFPQMFTVFTVFSWRNNRYHQMYLGVEPLLCGPSPDSRPVRQRRQGVLRHG